MTMKKLAYGCVALAGLCGVLAFTPMGAAAQQSIRNVVVDGFDTLLTGIAAIELASESSATSLDNIESNLSADAVHGNDVIATGPQGECEAYDVDGAAAPNDVAEGKSARVKCTRSGVGAVMLTNEDGSAVGAVAQSGTWTVQPGNTANTTAWLVTLEAAKYPCQDASQVTSVAIDTATSGNVQLVAISGSTVVYVCGFDVTSAADVSVQFISGTGSACATGETNKTGLYQLSAASGAGLRGIARPNGGSVQFKGAAGEAVCIELSGAVQVDGLLTYVQR
jgi:hypothetical protein